MSLLICAATEEELRAIAPKILPDVIEEMRPMAANLKHGAGIFMTTGVGPINAALAVGHCLGLTAESPQKVEAILNIGVAGAFDLEQTPLLSILRVKREYWPEYGLNDGSTVMARAFRFPQWKKTDGNDIYETLELDDLPALSKWTASRIKADWRACVSITVAGATAGFARKNDLWNTWHASLENMEGFAVAYVAARAEIPCVEIRAVSNKVGPRSKAEKDFDGAIAELDKILPALNLL